MCECCSEHADGKTERMLMSAIEMEKEGLAFYAQASEQTHNELGKRIFRSLEKDEISHVRTIQAIYEALHHGEAWPSAAEPPAGQADLRAMIERFAADHQAGLHAATDDLSAIDIGLDFERRSVAFYMEQADRTTTAREREFLKRLLAEEQLHWNALSELKAFLLDPASWFQVRERSMFDGG